MNMIPTSVFLERAELECQLVRLRSLVHFERRLPSNVFNRQMNTILFFEFDAMLEPIFWPVLGSAAQKDGASQVVLTVIDPDPIEYYYSEFGYCSSFRLPIDAAGDDYLVALKRMPDKSEADALLYNSSIVIWTSEKGDWVAWGERDKSVGVFGTMHSRDSITIPKDLSISTKLAVQLIAKYSGECADDISEAISWANKGVGE